MPTLQDFSHALVELLELEHQPIAITFETEIPNDRRFFDEPLSSPTEDGRSGRVPAPCVFWMFAHEQTFTTLPPDHGNCSVGLYTHGLAEASDIINKTDVGALLEVGWVTMDDFAGVAKLSRRPRAITYGPLSAAEAPDVVLLRLKPAQMMKVNDAIAVEFSSKPQCQILPRAAERGLVAASMGCALSRARTGMGDDELTCAIPASRLAELVDSLSAVTGADKAVVGYAAADKARFT